MLGYDDTQSPSSDIFTGMVKPRAWALLSRYIHGNDDTRSLRAPRPIDFGNGDIRSLGAPLPIASGMIVSVCVRACVDYVGALTG